MNKSISQETVDFERAFSFVDKRNNGSLDIHQIKMLYLSLFGYKPSLFELNNLARKVKYNYDNEFEEIYVSKEDLWKHLEEKFQYKNKYDELREIFQSFDIQCKGFINFEDFKKAIKLKNSKMDELKILKYFRELDTNLDDRVSFHEFLTMMEHSKLHGSKINIIPQ